MSPVSVERYVAVIGGATLVGLGLLADRSSLDRLIIAYIFASLAVTVDVQWGYTGILTFGSAATFGVGAYAIGIMFVHITGAWWALPLALIAGMVAAAALNLVLGWLAFYTRTQVSVFYIAIVTLAASVLLHQVVTDGGELTGASTGLSNFETLPLDRGTWYWLAAGLLFVVSTAAWMVVHSDAGLILRGVRDQEQRLRYLGFDVSAIKTGVFVVAGAVAGLIGGAYAAYSTVVAPSLVAFSLAANVLIWTALGGRGTILGPVLAAVVISFVSPSLNIAFPLVWQLFIGLAFVVVVMFASEGMLPAMLSLARQSVRGASRRSTALRRVAERRERTGNAARSGEPPLPFDILSVRPRDTPRAPGVNAVVLQADEVHKSFGSFIAVNGVKLTASAGELIGIVGPNGAGKTTLIQCIADGTERSSGDILVEGKPIGNGQPNEVARMGVARKFQAPAVFETMTVGECIKLASWHGRIPSIMRRSPRPQVSPACATVLELTGLVDAWRLRARDLVHGQKQALELAMVLAHEPDLLLLDEPTAGLTLDQRRTIGDVLMKLVERGMCILLVEHDFNFVKTVASRLVVLHEGTVIADGTVDDVARADAVQRIYLGIRQ